MAEMLHVYVKSKLFIIMYFKKH